MSETPRTQQLLDIANDEGISDAAVALVLQEHSEQLEREIAEANIEIEGLEEEIVALCDRLKEVNGGELRRQLVEARADAERLRMALEALYSWVKAEADHFGANAPDDDMIVMVSSAIKAAKGEV